MVVPRDCAVAIGSRGVAVVAAPGANAPWVRGLSPIDGTTWPSLAQALHDAAAAGVLSPNLQVAVLPSLVEVCAVSIPPVSDEDARRLLTRAASRHFVSAREPMEVAVLPAATRNGGARLSAAVPSRLLRAIRDAAREAGVSISRIEAAQTVLTRARRRAPNQSNATLVRFDTHTELLIANGGVLSDVRRFRLEGDDEAIAEATRLAGPLTRVDDALTTTALALSAEPSDEPSLVWQDASAKAGHRAAQHTSAWRMLGVAALLAVGTIAMQELDVRRELAAVRAERAALAPAIAATNRPDMATREQLASLSPDIRLSGVIAALGDALPADAHITRLRAQRDTIVVEGRAERATSAFEALTTVPWATRVMASAPVRRETADDGSASEHFEFTIVLRGR